MNIRSSPDGLDDENANIIVFYESISGDRYCSTYYTDEEGPILNYEDNPWFWPD
ncbi:hypothetical protein [Granulicella mallensis]|uniref:Uncharacterized protein n=1 Tax=Granulicella mallensis TaxID=940614 RepID=A0A7W7ZQY7_9BACT|nr:hypothetical protein [Granulicella mallensis]MBB5063671.1 hypothetical protein [Granulicella mallensis]